MNSFRAKKREQAKAMGYEIQSFVSKKAIVYSNVEIQENTLIYEWVIVQAGVVLGSNVTINPGGNIGHHSSVGGHPRKWSWSALEGQILVFCGLFIKVPKRNL